MGRPAKHDAGTRAALLDAAEELLATGGPDAVSIRGVADAIGESTRAVYSSLGSKQALIEGLAARGFGYLADLVEAVPVTDDPAHDLVEVGVRGFRTFAIGRPHLFRITFDELSPEVYRQADVYPELDRSFAALSARIGAASRAKQLGRRPVVEVAFMFHSVCHGLAANELSRLPPPVGAGFWGMTAGMDVERVWRTALGAFVRGLSATEGVPRARRVRTK
jgi:AcrR family transcriptional regulator